MYISIGDLCTKIFLFGHVDRVFYTESVPTFICNAGSELLIRELPSILDGSARLKAQPQDDSKATLAPKVCEP